MNQKALSWVLLLTLTIVWGSSFILMKRGLDAFSSDEVAAIRISMAFLFLLPFHIRHSRINLKKYFAGLLYMGVLGNLLPAFLFTASETQISSSLAGMLNALTPLFTIVVGVVWLKQKPSGRQVWGIVVGLAAATCLILFDGASDVFKNFSFGFLVVLATFFYAISLNGIKKYLGDLNSVTATVWAFTLIGPVALIYLFGFTSFTKHCLHPQAISSLGYLSILSVIGSAVSVILYNHLIKISGTVFASTCTYLMPIVAIMWGLSDGETVSAGQLVSMTILILSVYLINRD